MTASRAVYPLFLLSLGGILRKWGADESREIKEGRRRVVARLRGGEDMIDITKGRGLPGTPYAEILPEDLFCRIYAGSEGQIGPEYLLIDVRDTHKFTKGHIAGSFNVRWSTVKRQLVDDAHMRVDDGWRMDLIDGKAVVFIDDAGKSNRNDWFQNMAYRIIFNGKRCRSLEILKGGFPAFESQYPFLITRSRVEYPRNAYPTPVIHGSLYLGTWRQAHDENVHKHLKIGRMIAVGGHRADVPRSSRVKRYNHLHIDPEGDSVKHPGYYPPIEIRRNLLKASTFIADALKLQEPILVYTSPLPIVTEGKTGAVAIAETAGRFSEGYGVAIPGIKRESPEESGSAAAVIMYLLVHKRWSPSFAFDVVNRKRSAISPSLPLWKALFEQANEMHIPEDDPERMFPPQLYQLILRSVFEQDSVKIHSEKRARMLNSEHSRIGKLSGHAILVANVEDRLGCPLPLPQHTVWLELNSRDLRRDLQIPLPKASIWTVGRKDNNDLRPAHASVSRNHSSVYIDDFGRVAVVDHGTKHGTFVNFRRLDPWQPFLVRRKDRIRFGGEGAPVYRLGSMSQEQVEQQQESRRIAEERGARKLFREREKEEAKADRKSKRQLKRFLEAEARDKAAAAEAMRF